MALVPTLRRYPIGALFGLVLTGAFSVLLGIVPGRLWLELPLVLICVPGCMLAERLLDWRFSGMVDARMRHAAAREDARLAFAKLEAYKARGVISKPDAYRIGAIIAKRDVAGGPRQTRGRGPGRKRAATPPTPAALQRDSSRPAPGTERPAA